MDGPVRADAKLPRVIVNEKRNKAATAFQVTAVPFPFQTREQYERSLQQPLGPDWNAQTSFQAAIKPRVITKRGAVIDPIDYKPAAAAAAAPERQRRRPL